MFADISLKWKVLTLALIGPVVMAVVLGIQQAYHIRASGHEQVIQQSRAVIHMAEAARDEMAKKLNMGIIKPFDQIDSRQHLLEAVPIITAINMATRKADELNYQFRVPKVSPRNPQNEPTELERSVLAELKRTGADEKIIIEDKQIRYFRPIRLTKDCLYCHGDPKGTKDPTGGTLEGWKAGEIHGAFEIVADLDAANARIVSAELATVGETVLILALIGLAVWLLVKRTIVRPLFGIKDFAQAVAEGDLEAEPVGSFPAELGVVKLAIARMVENLKAKMNEAAQKKDEAREAQGRAEEAMQEAKGQEAKANDLLGKMQKVASEASLIAEQVSSAAEELSAQADQVSEGAVVQSDRAGQTATAMEEMNATVLEVARNSANSAASATQAKEKAALMRVSKFPTGWSEGISFTDEWYTDEELCAGLACDSRAGNNNDERRLLPAAALPDCVGAFRTGRDALLLRPRPHYPLVWKEPFFREMLTNGIDWAMGNKYVDITPNIGQVTQAANQFPVPKGKKA